MESATERSTVQGFDVPHRIHVSYETHWGYAHDRNSRGKRSARCSGGHGARTLGESVLQVEWSAEVRTARELTRRVEMRFRVECPYAESESDVGDVSKFAATLQSTEMSKAYPRCTLCGWTRGCLHPFGVEAVSRSGMMFFSYLAEINRE